MCHFCTVCRQCYWKDENTKTLICEYDGECNYCEWYLCEDCYEECKIKYGEIEVEDAGELVDRTNSCHACEAEKKEYEDEQKLKGLKND